MKYKLDVARDVDVFEDNHYSDYILNLPKGFRFYDDVVHVRGYDSLADLRKAAKQDVIVCTCKDCDGD